MNRSAKVMLGVATFAAPITAGWMLTSSPSVLPGIGIGHHTIDEFEMSGHWVLREEIDGKVTEVVTAPDGRVLRGEEIPSDIADALHNWAPPRPMVEVDLDRDPACWVIAGEVEGEERAHGTTDNRAFALRGDVGSDGTVAVEAVVFDDPDDLPDDLDDYVDSGSPLIDLPGATEIGECG